MSARTVRNGLICLVALAVAVAVGVLGAAHSATMVDDHSDLFPKAVIGIAGLSVLGAAALTLEPAWLLAVGLALSIFSGNWSNLHVPLPLDRLVTLVGVAAVLVRPFLVADAPRLEIRRIHWLLALLAVYAIGSAVAVGSIEQHTALFELLDRLGIEPFVLFLVAPAAFASARQRRILLVTLAVIGFYLGVIAILERVGPHSLVVPAYIENPNIGIHFDRARGPFLEAGADGLAMFNGLVACVMLLGQRVGRNARWALALTIVLCVVGIVLTLTRQVWLGAAVGSLVAAALSARLRRLIPAATLGVAALLGIAVLVIPGLRTSITSRTSDQSSLWDRYNSNSAALRMFEAHPLTGVGWGEFPDKSGRYYHVDPNYPLTAVNEVHNVVLSNAAELGFLGVAMWLVAVVLAVLGPLTRRGPPELVSWKLATVAIGVAWFVQINFAPVSYAFDNYVPWIFAALAAVGASAGSVDPREALAQIAEVERSADPAATAA